MTFHTYQQQDLVAPAEVQPWPSRTPGGCNSYIPETCEHHMHCVWAVNLDRKMKGNRAKEATATRRYAYRKGHFHVFDQTQRILE